MKRGLSELLVVLLLSVILSSMIVLSLSLYSSLVEEARRTASEVSQNIYESLSPPVLSLFSDEGSLVLEVYTNSPVRVEYALVIYENSQVLVKQMKEDVESYERFLLLENYSCEKVRVFLVLEGGRVVSWHPERDPRLGRVPPMWDGWYSCNLRSNSTNALRTHLLNGAKIFGHTSVRTDPMSSLPVFEALAPNASISEVLRPRISLSFTLYFSGSYIAVYTTSGGMRKSSSGSLEIAAIDLGGGRILRIVARMQIVVRSEHYVTQHVWIELLTSEPALYRGSAEIVLDRFTSYVSSPYLLWGGSDGANILVLAYSPGGSQSFNTTCINTELSSGGYLFTVEGWARGAYETSGPIYIFYNGFAKSFRPPKLRVNITIEEVVLYSLKPAKVRVEGVETLSVRTATSVYSGSSGYDYLTISIDEVMRSSIKQHLWLGVCYSIDSCSYRELSNKWTYAWSPIGVFEIKAWPKVGQALRAINMSVKCYKQYYSGSGCLHWSTSGHSSEDLLPSPWSLPHIAELRFSNGERALVVFPASSGSLFISADFWEPQRGYVTTVYGVPALTNLPSHWVSAQIVWDSLTVYVLGGIYGKTLKEPSKPQSYYIATATTRALLHESLLVWVS
ncbi:MAG: hypothetical protein QXN05_01325 [Acidilobaceae archaeon]